MSIFGAMFSGVTGLHAQSQALGMIADNIANVNTIGYKGTTARFFSLVTQAASRTTYTPGGVASSPAQGIDRQGLLQASTSKTDIAIAGRGFFVVNQSSGSDEQFLFTRAGSFNPDQNGNLVNTAGYFLQGWPLTDGTTLPTNTSTLSSVETVNVANLAGTATPTSTVNLSLNLPSTAPAAAGGGQINTAISSPLDGITAIDYKTFGTLNNVEKITYDGVNSMTITIGGQTGIFDLTNAVPGIYKSTGTLAGMEITLSSAFDFATAITTATNADPVVTGGTLDFDAAVRPKVTNFDAGDLKSLSASLFQFSVTTAGVVTLTSGPTGYTLDAAQTGALDTDGTVRNIVVTDGTNTFNIEVKVTTAAGGATGTFDIDLIELQNSFGLGVAPGNGRFAATVQIFDSLGNAHDLVIDFDKTATNQWEILVNDPVLASTGVTSGTVAAASRSITFNGDGTPAAITFPAIAISAWTTGANNSSVAINLGTASKADGVTQFAGDFALSSIDQNGVTFGGFVGVNIAEDGKVTAVFDNGEQLAIYQLPLSLFANPNGLEAVTGNAFRQTDKSGDILLQQAATGGSGTVASSALESSTVDLAEEFTKMITTQRAYSAAAKIITTADEMLEELIRIRR